MVDLKVGYQEDDRAPGDDVVHEIECADEVRAEALWFEAQDFPHQPEHVSPTFARRHVELDLVAKENQPNFVVIAHRGECQDACDLGGKFSLALRTRAEVTRGAYVDYQHQCQLAFLDEFFHERATGSRSHV